ncbi:DUF6714 family protein [Hydrogenophaga sp.]|uniref:DUF6714 family protein n=1 Tax=Hydrogenophaga sp. TaxID=1904254 RepID=UPI0026274666|nr:DUF6714 family protein [Hydrogenophaga sp.]MDM7951206.1 hypothetical protein [Hydrogenophaga sp.]
MSVDISLFDQRPFSSEVPLVPPGREGDRWENDEVIRFFKGKCIQEVSYEALKSDYKKDWTAAHHLMSDQAFAFFLPSLLRLSQDNYEDSTDNAGLLADSLVFMFRRMAEGTMDHRLLPLLRAYSKRQLGVISLFLQEMSEQHYQGMGDMDDAAVALKLFWSQYLPSK